MDPHPFSDGANTGSSGGGGDIPGDPSGTTNNVGENTEANSGGDGSAAVAPPSDNNNLALPPTPPHFGLPFATSPFFGAQLFQPGLAPQPYFVPLALPPQSQVHQQQLARQLQLEQQRQQQQQPQPPPRKAPRRGTDHDTAAAPAPQREEDPAATAAALVASIFGEYAEDAAALGAAFTTTSAAAPANNIMSPEAMNAIEMDVVREMTANAGGAPAPSDSNAQQQPPQTLPSNTASHPSLASLNVMPPSQLSSSLPTSMSSAPTPSMALSQPLQPQGTVRHNAALTSAMTPPHLSQDAVHCVACGFAGADMRIKCANRGKCAYHARCIDLVALCSNAHQQQGPDGDRDHVVIRTCPHCHQQAKGLEIVPLSFAELDRAQRMGMQKKGLLLGALAAQSTAGDGNKKRSSSDLEAGGTLPSNIAQACAATNTTSGTAHYGRDGSGALSSSQCYDPAVPRTGRWTDEELAFRDALIAHFLDGALPLSNGTKLNDFLANMLKSKQSRLTKKMKHAKLSTKYFRIKEGHLTPAQKAKEFSSMEYNFVNVVADPIERSEIQFHMQREWRDHLAERCTYLRIMFDADAWLRSVDAMDRRVALEKNRSRMVKRRCLMGKAMEKDVSESLPGVFIDQGADRTEDFLMDMEAKQQQAAGGGGGAAGGGEEDDGDLGRFLMSMLDEAPITSNPATAAGSSHPSAAVGKKEKGRSSYTDPNFRYAAPFLAGITSYIERNGVPFEHVDVWVPSTVPQALEAEKTAPTIGSMGSGSSTNLTAMGGSGTDGSKGGVTRLCFAGSATVGAQIVDEPSSDNPDENKGADTTKKIVPLTADEIFNFSLYGDYSEKFSFSSGCGLPGRVYASGVAAWEQFLANAPAEMFERRGGAIQFGIKTALGLPIDSPNVGRIVVVLYSMHNREKDEELVNRTVKDVRLFNPCARWKLVVDVRSTNGNTAAPSPVAARPPPMAAAPSTGLSSANSSSFHAGMSALSMQPEQQQNASASTSDGKKNIRQNQTTNLINLLQENLPSDPSTSPLGNQINSIMTLRMILLRASNRTPEEEQLVDTILVLYESYIAAGRTRSDIALLVTRDYEFHVEHQARMAAFNQPQPTQQGIESGFAPQPNLQGQGAGSMAMQGQQYAQHLLHGMHQQPQMLIPHQALTQQGMLSQPQFQLAHHGMTHPYLQQQGLQPMDMAAQPSSLLGSHANISQQSLTGAAAPKSPSDKASES